MERALSVHVYVHLVMLRHFVKNVVMVILIIQIVYHVLKIVKQIMVHAIILMTDVYAEIQFDLQVVIIINVNQIYIMLIVGLM
jgi:hypothetical protein